jgi:hypothetical protein
MDGPYRPRISARSVVGVLVVVALGVWMVDTAARAAALTRAPSLASTE